MEGNRKFIRHFSALESNVREFEASASGEGNHRCCRASETYFSHMAQTSFASVDKGIMEHESTNVRGSSCKFCLSRMEYYRPKRRNWRKPSLVLAALATVLRGQPGRDPGDPPSQGLRRTANDGTTFTTLTEQARSLRGGTCRGGLSRRTLGEGGSVRVLAFHPRRSYGGQGGEMTFGLQAKPVAHACFDQRKLLGGQSSQKSLGFCRRNCNGILNQKGSGLEKWDDESNFEIGTAQ